jgi:NTE family protein
MTSPRRPVSYNKTVGLVLQGGGALGSYQAGVYEALSHSDYLPDWVAGISIGAINAALIAGNAPERRVDRLHEFWDLVTQPTPIGVFALPTNRQSAPAASLMFGQQGFFRPRAPLDWLIGPPPESYYDTSELRRTLERLVDFDRINAREIRFSVGAVNVRTGNFRYFDNHRDRIGAAHVMASGALPPAFPAVEIDGEFWWDGGLVSNTPLEYVIEYVPRCSRLIFQVDLFPARGAVPHTLEQVGERDKDIRYSSRTRAGTDTMLREHDLRHNINLLWDRLPPELRATDEAQYLYNFGCVTTMDIVQLIDRAGVLGGADWQGASKDYEFSRETMLARWGRGCTDAEVTLAASPWLAPMPPDLGARTFDVLRPAEQQTAG